MTDLRPSVVLVGESPPAGAPPDFKPFDCASGTNLCRHLGFTSRAVLLDHVPRDNIFATPGVGLEGGPAWDDDIARGNGSYVLRKQRSSQGVMPTVIALGQKPSAALGVGDLPWYAWRRDPETGVHVVTAPHPSGRASIVTRTRDTQATFRRALLPDIIAGCHALRPWHFTMGVDDIKVDLGAALCPYDPAVGVIAATLAWEAAASPVVMPEIHAATEALSMLDIIRALAASPSDTVKSRVDALRNLYRLKRGTDLKARVASAEKTLVGTYPAEVLRATIGRYVALGVL